MLEGWQGVTVTKNKDGSIHDVRCSEHGSMNKVSKHGIWRCLACHVGYDQVSGEVLKDSTEGFKKHPIKILKDVVNRRDEVLHKLK